MTAVHIGTSGWHYDHWIGPFYPHDLDKADLLAHYAERLPSVEINNSFYSLPEPDTLRGWRASVPDSFSFAVKASRYITHMKKLKDASEPLATLFDAIEPLDDQLGPVLFQLPPNWRCNPERLARFLDQLPGGQRCAIEFRDPSWFTGEVTDLLAAHDVAFCIYELDGRLSPKHVTTDFVYVRLHGPRGPYQGDYDKSTLAGWAGAFSSWRRQGRDIFCYFDNDQAGYAVKNAQSLHAMVAD